MNRSASILCLVLCTAAFAALASCFVPGAASALTSPQPAMAAVFLGLSAMLFFTNRRRQPIG